MSLSRRGFIEIASIGTALSSVPAFAVAGGSNDAEDVQQGTKIVNLDERVTFAQQLEHNVAPVVLLSTFLVSPEHVDKFLEGFKKQFSIMHKQPGLISAQLHRGIAGSCLFVNYVVWESVNHFKRGYESPEFQAQLKAYPPGTVVTANFFQRVAVEGMCVGEGTVDR